MIDRTRAAKTIKSLFDLINDEYFAKKTDFEGLVEKVSALPDHESVLGVCLSFLINQLESAPSNESEIEEAFSYHYDTEPEGPDEELDDELDDELDADNDDDDDNVELDDEDLDDDLDDELDEDLDDELDEDLDDV